jgi:hypothetical protein
LVVWRHFQQHANAPRLLRGRQPDFGWNPHYGGGRQPGRQSAASHLMTAEQFRKPPEDGWPPKREDRLGLPAPDGVKRGPTNRGRQLSDYYDR